MRISYLCLILLTLSWTKSGAQAARDSIRWNKNYRITWEDFKGKPDSSDKQHGAVSVCSIAYKYSFRNGHLYFETWSIFYRDRSFYRAGRVDSLTLNHERGHFDIAEVFARKLKLVLSKYSVDVNNYKRDIDSMADSCIAEADKMNETYDKQTEYPRNTTKQIEWNKRIDSLLRVYLP